MKILISAYACEPDKGSEPAVGWQWTRQAAGAHDVWVITRANNRAVIERALAGSTEISEALAAVRWIYVDLPRWSRFWKQGRRGLYAYYLLWQIAAYRAARRLHHQHGFDVAHHLTFGTYWLPSALAWLPIPFIWGPVGGAEHVAGAFYRDVNGHARLYETSRNTLRAVTRFNPLVRHTLARAALVWAKAPDTAAYLAALTSRPVECFAEPGFTPEEAGQLAQIPIRDTAPVRFISSGRLLHWKGFHLGLRAFAALDGALPGSEYWVAGDGPERARLETLAESLGIADRVRFWGLVPREKLLSDVMTQTSVLVHPSLHDSGGWAVPEAMAAGRPVICLDLGGPALHVTSQTGIKVPARTPEQVVADLSAAMLRLGQDHALRAGMSTAARQHIRDHYCWDRKQARLLAAYKRIAER